MKNRVLNGLLILAIAFWAGCGGSKNETSVNLEKGLVAYYPLSEGTGTVLVDHSGNGNDGTISGGASWVTGETDYALSFDGVDDAAVVTNTNILNSVNEVTLTAWVKAPDLVSMRYFLALNGCGFGFWQKPGSAVGFAISVPGTSSAAGTFTTGSWQFLAGTFDGTDIKFYVNGDLQETTNHPGTMTLGSLSFGVNGSAYWVGIIDEVRVYDRVLSATEINELMNN